MPIDILLLSLFVTFSELRYYCFNEFGYESLIYGLEYLYLEYMGII